MHSMSLIRACNQPCRRGKPIKAPLIIDLFIEKGVFHFIRVSKLFLLTLCLSDHCILSICHIHIFIIDKTGLSNFLLFEFIRVISMILVYHPLFDRQFLVYRDKRNAIALIHFLQDVYMAKNRVHLHPISC